MKKLILLVGLFFVIMGFGTGCTRKYTETYNYFYQAENTHWTAIYNDLGVIKETRKDGWLYFDGNTRYYLTVKYKGDLKDLSQAKHIKIEYKIGNRGGSIDEEGVNEIGNSSKTFSMQGQSNGNIIPDKSEVMKLTINLDGKLETLNLKYKSNYPMPIFLRDMKVIDFKHMYFRYLIKINGRDKIFRKRYTTANSKDTRAVIYNPWASPTYND